MYGSLAPGAQLSESALAAEFGVSRGPLREAMQRLVQEGLVRSEPNRGLFVKVLETEDIRDLYVARTAVETAAGHQIVLGAGTPTAVEDLRQAYQHMQQEAETGTLDSLSNADFAFHSILVAASDSARLQRMHETLMVETRMCLTALQGTYRDPEDQVHEHRLITEAIAASDDQLMISRIQSHMHEALMRLITN